MTRPFDLRSAGDADGAELARLHAACFDQPWSGADFAALLRSGAFGFLACVGEAAGFALMRTAGGEAEILSIGVAPRFRRSGLGAALMRRCLDAAAYAGAEAMFLDVAEGNHAALGLYTGLGFRIVTRRADYYSGAGGSHAALVLKLEIGK
ncbi:MAG: GNAT family N-acetyltransferase [Hyphomicrobiales bacterium]|nr:GNAT family N-acetyltransferase [Hyphomicrobiales bacterium]